ncbi:hypothetical protein QQP08_011125 [Theobroma cacao]|nr:hypothetical protein QQP08_011125 [Theobroma cacao]
MNHVPMLALCMYLIHTSIHPMVFPHLAIQSEIDPINACQDELRFPASENLLFQASKTALYYLQI